MDVVPEIIAANISKRNGMIYCITGSGGSGKTNLLLNFFESKNLYQKKFNNIWYICPDSSFSSVVKHSFKDHDKVIHDVTPDV